MPAPSITEYGKLSALSLIRHYQIHRQWYVQQARVLVANARTAISIASENNQTTSIPVFNPDDVGLMLRVWLIGDPQWLNLLKRKPHLPVTQYDLLTDAMARYVAYDAYVSIIY